MRLQHLELKGFKKYLSHTFDFGPKLNVVVGPNETGKTSLHQAIVTCLYGVGSKADKLLKSKADARHWVGDGECSLKLNFTLENRDYTLVRDIDKGELELREILVDGTTRQISNDAKNIDKWIARAIRIPTAAIFNQTLSVQQGDMTGMDELKQIGETIESILSGENRVSAEGVLERLNNFRKNLRKQRNEKPGRIDQLELDVQKARTDLQTATSQADERERLTAQLKTLSVDVPKQKARLKELEEMTQKADNKQKSETTYRAKQEEYRNLNNKLKKTMEIRTRFDLAAKAFAGFAKLAEHPGEIDILRRGVQELAGLAQKKQLEMERMDEEHKHTLVLVQNKQVVLKRATLAISAVMVMAGVGAAVMLKFPWFGLISLAGFGWLALTILQQRRQQSGVHQELKSERLLQIEAEIEQKRLVMTKSLSTVDLEPKLLDEPDRLEPLFAEYQSKKAEMEKEEHALKLYTEETDQKAMEKQLETIAFEGEGLRKQLEAFKGFEPSAEEIHRWTKELEALHVTLPAAEHNLSLAEGRLGQMKLMSADVPGLQSRVEYLDNEIKILTVRHQAVLLAIETLEQIVTSYRAEFLPKLETLSSEYFKRITTGRYPRIQLTDHWPEIRLPVDKIVSAHPDQLSAGAADQLYFSLRIAAADLMSQNEKLPLILDDPFVNFDEERYLEALKLVYELGQDRQLIYFTARHSVRAEMKAFAKEHGEVNWIELKR